MPDLTQVKKFFPTPAEGTVAMGLGSSIAPGATTVPVNGMSNYSDGQTVVFAVDPTLSTKQVFTGVKSGANVTNVVWTFGTNVTHNSGATVVDYVSASTVGMLSAGVQKEHNQDGSHKTTLTVYNVKTYGALGDGTTNDTSAIQAAINAASAAGGGTVFFPQGVYVISDSLVLASFVSLVGVGSASTNTASTIKMTSTTASALKGVNTTASLESLNIEKLRIVGPGSGSGHGIYLQNTGSGGSHPPFTYLSFRDLYIATFGGYGFNAESLIVSVVERVVSESNSTGGFYLNGAAAGAYTTVSTSTSFIDCYANGNGTYGYRSDYNNYISYYGCAADSNGTGYYINATAIVALVGCGVELGATDAASPGDGFKINACNQIGLYNCYSFQNKHYTFWVTGNSVGVTLMGCLDSTPVAGQVNGLKVDSGSAATLIATALTGSTSNAGKLSILADQSGSMNANVSQLNESNGVKALAVGTNASGVNWATLTPGSTGAAVKFGAGGETNVDLQVDGKGSGKVVLGSTSTGNIQSVRQLNVMSGTATPAGGTAGAGLTLGTTANLGVFFGSGAPSLAAAQGSLYIRTDGSSTSTRLYVNTDGNTTWTNVTTAA